MGRCRPAWSWTGCAAHRASGSPRRSSSGPPASPKPRSATLPGGPPFAGIRAGWISPLWRRGSPRWVIDPGRSAWMHARTAGCWCGSASPPWLRSASWDSTRGSTRAGGTAGWIPASPRCSAGASLLVATPVALWCATPFFAGAWAGLRHRMLHMDVPVALGIAVLYLHGVWATLAGRDGYPRLAHHAGGAAPRRPDARGPGPPPGGRRGHGARGHDARDGSPSPGRPSRDRSGRRAPTRRSDRCGRGRRARGRRHRDRGIGPAPHGAAHRRGGAGTGRARCPGRGRSDGARRRADDPGGCGGPRYRSPTMAGELRAAADAGTRPTPADRLYRPLVHRR